MCPSGHRHCILFFCPYDCVCSWKKKKKKKKEKKKHSWILDEWEEWRAKGMKRREWWKEEKKEKERRKCISFKTSTTIIKWEREKMKREKGWEKKRKERKEEYVFLKEEDPFRTDVEEWRDFWSNQTRERPKEKGSKRCKKERERETRGGRLKIGERDTWMFSFSWTLLLLFLLSLLFFLSTFPFSSFFPWDTNSFLFWPVCCLRVERMKILFQTLPSHLSLPSFSPSLQILKERKKDPLWQPCKRSRPKTKVIGGGKEDRDQKMY